MTVKEIIRGAASARHLLKSLDFPYSDEITLQPSNRQLPGGGHYGVQIPVITSISILEKTIKMLKECGIRNAVFGETVGSFLLSDSELKEMLSICAEEKYGMFFSTGARPEYDRKATFYRSEFGIAQGRRVNNNDAIARSVDEVLKLIELGCRGIIFYDIGILRIMNTLRTKGMIPDDVMFSTSTHCIISNPMTACVYADEGANELVVLHDIGLPVLQDMRRLLPDSVALSLPIDVYKSKGGFIRYYEIPEIVQVASPIFLKLGASAQAHPYETVAENTIRTRIQRILIGLEYLEKANLNLTPIPENSKYLGIPKIKSLQREKIPPEIQTV